MKNRWGRSNCGGILLVLIVEVLALIALISVVLVVFASIRLQPSTSYLSFRKNQAEEAARGGIEAAIAHLTRYSLTHNWDSPRASWRYEPKQSPANGRLTPLAQSRHPSLSPGSSKPSGKWTSDDGEIECRYRLKIWDLASGIHWNLPPQQLAHLLPALGRGIEIFTNRTNPLTSPVIESLIKSRRRGEKISSSQDLLRWLNSREIELLAPFTTSRGWSYPTTYRKKSLPQKPSPLARRHPINLNTAPLAVLYAALRPLRGRFQTSDATYSAQISSQEAKKLVEALEAYRNQTPLQNWSHLYRFLREYSDLTEEVKTMILVNSCPHPLSPRLLPSRWTSFKLTRGTVEFTFHSHGYFHIESLGQVETKDGRVLAQSHISAEVKVIEVLTLGHQRDFVFSSLRHEGMTTGPHSEKRGQISMGIQPGWLQLSPSSPPYQIENLTFYLPWSRPNHRRPWVAEMGLERHPQWIDLAGPHPGHLAVEGIDLGRQKRPLLSYSLGGNIPRDRGAAEVWFSSRPDRGGEVWWQATWPEKSGFWHWLVRRQGKKLATYRWYRNNRGHIESLSVVEKDLPRHGKWHHLVITWEGKRQEMYLNGRKSSLSLNFSQPSPSSFMVLPLPLPSIGWWLLPFSSWDWILSEGPAPLVPHHLTGNLTFGGWSWGRGRVMVDDFMVYSRSPYRTSNFAPPPRYQVLDMAPAYWDFALPIPRGSNLGWWSSSTKEIYRRKDWPFVLLYRIKGRWRRQTSSSRLISVLEESQVIFRFQWKSASRPFLSTSPQVELVEIFYSYTPQILWWEHRGETP